MALAVAVPAAPAHADGADVVDVVATQANDGTYDFAVTVRHDDTGWDDYADQWQVVGADGTVYGERVLLHPHVDEQPFTRRQGGIEIPTGIREVTVRAHSSVAADGWNGEPKTIGLKGR